MSSTSASDPSQRVVRKGREAGWYELRNQSGHLVKSESGQQQPSCQQLTRRRGGVDASDWLCCGDCARGCDETVLQG
eukprot:306806-Hanusia_phi.AAC.3